MKILVFEYSTISSDNHLVHEGFNMLHSILTDLDNINEFEVYYLINKNYKIEGLNNCKNIHITTNLMEWLDKNASFYEYCLFIAPEDNFIQYNITRILEKNNVIILGSNSYASSICSSKNKTYKYIPHDIKKIPSIKKNINQCTYHKIKDIFKQNELIIKPDNQTSSNFIYKVHTENEFNKILNIYKENNIEDILIQKYIEGNSVSTSIICNEEYIQCISLNSQIIENKKNQFKYKGCISPINHPLKNELYKISEKIVKSIPGLKGFIGLDFIIQDKKIYFVEINSRITTPFIVLHENTNVNLTKFLIDISLGKKDFEIQILNEGKFIN